MEQLLFYFKTSHNSYLLIEPCSDHLFILQPDSPSPISNPIKDRSCSKKHSSVRVHGTFPPTLYFPYLFCSPLISTPPEGEPHKSRAFRFDHRGLVSTEDSPWHIGTHLWDGSINDSTDLFHCLKKTHIKQKL